MIAFILLISVYLLVIWLAWGDNQYAQDLGTSSRLQTEPSLIGVDGSGRDFIPDCINEIDWGSSVRG